MPGSTGELTLTCATILNLTQSGSGITARLSDEGADVHHHRAPSAHSAQRRRHFAMKDAALVEQGTHDELLKKGGVYAHLHELQTTA
jgi:hypothetical protein